MLPLLLFTSSLFAGDATLFKNADRIELHWTSTASSPFFGSFYGYESATPHSKFYLVLDLCLWGNAAPVCREVGSIGPKTLRPGTSLNSRSQLSVSGKKVREAAMTLLKDPRTRATREEFTFRVRFSFEQKRDLAASEIGFTSDRTVAERAYFRLDYEVDADKASLDGRLVLAPD